MANVISYKGQKYVRVDGVKPRTRLDVVNNNFLNVIKRLEAQLKKAGFDYIVKDYSEDTRSRDSTTYTSGGAIVNFDRSRGYDFFKIVKPYFKELEQATKKDIDSTLKKYEQGGLGKVEFQPLIKSLDAGFCKIYRVAKVYFNQ